MHAVIYRHTENGSKTLAIVEMKDGKVEVRTTNETIKKRILEGVFSNRGFPISAADGKKFIEALPHVFHGAMISAELVRDD